MKYLSTTFTKIDRFVFTVRGLSDGSKTLYGYVAGLESGANFSDKYIMKALDISRAVLYRRKKELIDAGLILIDRTDIRSYALYVGTTKSTAQSVRDKWVSQEDYTEE